MGAKRALPLSRVYGLLEPGPVVLLATAAHGRPNLMPMSWHMMVEFEPPLVACVVSERNFSFAALKATRECTINIPSVELARKVVRCGNATGRTVDKFEAYGLTPVPAASVRPPLVGECWANLEARVVDTRMVWRYGIFLLEVVRAWVDPARKRPRTIHHLGHGNFFAAGRTFHLASAKP